MACNVIHSMNASGGITGSTAAITATWNTTTGNSLALIMLTGANVTVSSIAVTTGAATFTKAVAQANGSLPVEIWSAAGITGGTLPKFTATFSGAPGACDMTLLEFTGGASDNSKDGTQGHTGTSSTSITTTAITTAVDGDLVCKGFNLGGTGNGSAESGWTEFLPSAAGDIAGWTIQTSHGSITGTNTQTPASSYTGAIAALKAQVVTSIAFTGAIQGSAAHASALIETNRIVGESQGKPVHFAALIETNPFLGAIQGKSAHISALLETNALSGKSQGAGGGSASVSNANAFRGLSQSSAINYSDILVGRNLSAKATAAGKPGASLFLINTLAGKLQGSGSNIGSAQATKPLRSVASGKASNSGSIVVRILLEGNATSTALNSAYLQQGIEFEGVLTGESGHYSSISVTRPLVGIAMAYGSNVADFGSTRSLEGNITGYAGSSADLYTVIQGGIIARAHHYGRVLTSVLFYGESTGGGSSFAKLDPVNVLVGVITGSASSKATISNGSNWYVTPAGGGSGTSWNSAWTLSTISWGSVHAGDTIWVAGGAYGNQLTNSMASGAAGNPIKLMRATINDFVPTHAPGWLPSMDAQVTGRMSSVNPQPNGLHDFTFDGRTPNGFQWTLTNGDTSFWLNTSGSGNNISFKYCTWIGPGWGSFSGYGVAIFGGSGHLFDHCKWDGVIQQLTLDSGPVTVQYCTFLNAGPGTTQAHSDMIYVGGGTNLIIRYCYFWNSWSQAFFWDGGNGGSGDFMYGNVAVQGPNGAGFWFETKQGYTWSPKTLYNNTMVNWSGGGIYFRGTSNGNQTMTNNLFWGTSWTNDGGTGSIVSSFNGYNGGVPGGDTNSTSNATNPFVNVGNTNILPTDYKLVASSWPINKGTTLTQDGFINKDMLGDTRTPVWDLGAFEFVSVSTNALSGVISARAADTARLGATKPLSSKGIATGRVIGPLRVLGRLNGVAVGSSASKGTIRVPVPPSFVTGQAAYTDAGLNNPLTSQAATFPGANTFGNIIVVFVAWHPGATSMNLPTDTAGNQYIAAAGPTVYNTIRALQTFYARVTNGIAGNVVTVTPTGGTACDGFDIRILEYTGIAGGLQQYATNTGTGTAVSAQVTTLTAPDILIAGDYSAATSQAGSGWTTRIIETNGHMVEDAPAINAGSYTATMSLSSSSDWLIHVLSFGSSLPDRPLSGVIRPGSNQNVASMSVTRRFGGISLGSANDKAALISLVPLRGKSQGGAAHKALISVTKALSAKSTGTGQIRSPLSVVEPLLGKTSGSGLHSAVITVTKALRGLSTGSGNNKAVLSSPVRFRTPGAIGKAAHQANISRTLFFNGKITSTGVLKAPLVTQLRFIGSTIGRGANRAALLVTRRLTGLSLGSGPGFQTFVQSAIFENNPNPSTTTGGIVSLANQVVSNSNIIIIRIGAPSAPSVTSVTDSLGNAYTLVGDITGPTGTQPNIVLTQMYQAPNIAGGNNIISIQCSAVTSIQVMAVEYSNLDSVDQSVSLITPSGASVPMGPITYAYPGELLIGYIVTSFASAPLSDPPGFTRRLTGNVFPATALSDLYAGNPKTASFSWQENGVANGGITIVSGFRNRAMSGYLTIGMPLVGKITGHASHKSTMTLAVPLAGVITGKGDPSGDLLLAKLMKGTASALASHVASLSEFGQLIGTVTAHADHKANLPITSQLSGKITGSAHNRAILSSPVHFPLSKVQGSALHLASIQVIRRLSAKGLATSLATARLGSGRLFSGNASGSAKNTGFMLITRALSGATNAQASIKADLSVFTNVLPLDGTALAASSSFGALRNVCALRGKITARFSGVGDIEGGTPTPNIPEELFESFGGVSRLTPES